MNKFVSGPRVAWLLAVVVLLAWGGALDAWFACDDFLWLDISRPMSVLASFVGRAGVIYDFRPILRVVFLIEWGLFREQALGWHLVNLAVHLGCAWLFWRLVAPWVGSVVATLAAVLFAASPLLQENVLWISGLGGSLSTALGLISLLCFGRYLQAPSGCLSGCLSARLLAAVIVADLAALASYEPMIVLPVIHLGILLAQPPRRWRGFIWLLAAHGALLIYRRLVLGSHISYAFRPVSAQGLRDLVRDYLPYVRQLLIPLRVLALALLPLIARRNRDLGRAVLIAMAGVAVVMLPYVVFRGVGSRYFYDAMLGVSLVLALLIQAIARFVPRGLGYGLMMVLALLVLVREARQARAETQDWVRAGQVGRDLIAKIAAAEPSPDPNALHVVLNLPVLVGDGELFFTYPGRAIRRFSRKPFDALWGGHQLVLTGGPGELDQMQKMLKDADQARASKGKPPLACLDAQVAAAATPVAVLQNASKCGLDVWEVQDGNVRRVSASEFWNWYQQNAPKE